MPVKSNYDYSAHKEYDFPKLMIDDDKTIVLFYSCGEGVVVGSNENYEEVGRYRSDWAMSFFKDYHGDMILSNR